MGELSNGIVSNADASQRYVRALVEHTADAIVLLSADGTRLYASPAIERVLGYAPHESIGESAFARIHPEDRERVRAAFQDLVQTPGRTITGQYRVAHRDGSWRWIETAGTNFLHDPAVAAVVLNYRDITDRVRREEAQRFLAEAGAVLASSLDYETTLSNVARLAVPHIADWCSVYIVDDDNVCRLLAVSHVDPAKVELAREYESRYPYLPDAPHGLGKVLRTGEPEVTREITEVMLEAVITDADRLSMMRELGFRSVMIVPLLGPEKVVGAIVFISAESRRLFDDADLTLAQELAGRAALAVDNARLYKAEQRARAEAEIALRLREEFLSMASHELKTPLTALHLQVQILRRGLWRHAEHLPERLLSTLDQLDRQLKRFARTIDGILDVTQIEAGRLALSTETLDLVPLMRDVVERFSPQLAQSNCEVRMEAPEPVIGCWDPARLDVVVTNLLSNAMKFGRQQPIDITITKRDDHARLTVHDYGIGISPEYQRRIFDRFDRGGVNDAYGGMGLGLYIVQQIIEAHGGTIEADSKPGDGTTFIVELPLLFSSREERTHRIRQD